MKLLYLSSDIRYSILTYQNRNIDIDFWMEGSILVSTYISASTHWQYHNLLNKSSTLLILSLLMWCTGLISKSRSLNYTCFMVGHNILQYS